MKTNSSTDLASKTLKKADSIASNRLKLEKRIKLISGILEKHQNARLATGGLFFLALVGLTIRSDLKLEVFAIGIFLAIFIWLVARTRRLQYHLTGLKRLSAFYLRQENRLRGKPAGTEWENALRLSREMSMIPDIGLMGSHSLWTLIDETLTDGGQRELLQWMSHPSPDLNSVRERQETVKKLRSEHWFYTRLIMIANREEFRVSSSQILHFLKTPFVSENFNRALVLIWMAWILAIAGITASIVNGWNLAAVFAAGYAALSYFILGSTGNTFGQGVGLAHHLSELGPVFHAIEKRALKTPLLREICPTIASSGPSREAKKVNFVLNFLGTQANPILHILINAVSPWTMTASFFLERRRRLISQSFPECLAELARFEALGSLVIFDRYQTSNYPDLRLPTSGTPEIAVRGIFHPLIERTQVIANDFSFPEGKTLGLLTGSNMSGKSTFLRTLGVNQVLANMGAPVFAESFCTAPLRIETCIEVSDSLRDGFSYFYAEVRKLKSILEVAEKGIGVLFLIDEIFRGTNNRERHIGSRAVIRALANTKGSLGFISTHDLELTVLEKQHSSLMNLHFKEDINSSGQMVFSYKLHSGPCPTTNALRIMASEGIDIAGLETNPPISQ